MSLINEVLKDLERRPHDSEVRAEIRRVVDSERSRAPLWIGLAVTAAIGATTVFWLFRDSRPESVPTPPLRVAEQEIPSPAAPQTQPAGTLAETETQAAPAQTPSAPETEPGALAQQSVQADTPASRAQTVPAEASPSPAEAADDSPAVEPAPAPVTERPALAAVREAVTQAPPARPAPAPPRPAAEPEPGTRDGGETFVIQHAAERSLREITLDSARRAIGRAQYRLAEQQLHTLIREDPAAAEPYLVLGRLLVDRGREREAFELLEGGLNQVAQADKLAELLGRLLLERAQAVRAARVLGAHAPDAVTHPDYHLLLAAAHRESGNHSAAADVYRQLSTIVPERGTVWIGLGASLEALDQPEQAREAYIAALSGDDPRAAQFARQRLPVLERMLADRR